MIDEKKLLKKLNEELDTAKARLSECEDWDDFYAAVCSALETTIKIVEREPKLSPEEIKKYLNSFYGIRGGFTLPNGYIDTDSVRIQSKEVENERK